MPIQPTQLASITMTQAQTRLREIMVMAETEYAEDAETERQNLYLDVLYTIANASGFADKRELRRMAAVALEAHEIKIERK